MKWSKKLMKEFHSPRALTAVLTVAMIFVIVFGANQLTGKAVAAPKTEPDCVLWYDFASNKDRCEGNDAQWSKVTSKSWAAVFAGTKDNFIIGDQCVDFPTTDITVTFWMYSDAVDRDAGLFTLTTKNSPKEFELFYDGVNMELFVGGQRTRITKLTDAIGKTLYNNQWNHVLVTWTSSTGKATLFVNGQLTGSTTVKRGYKLGTEIKGTARGADAETFKITQDKCAIVIGQDLDCKMATKCRPTARSDAVTGGRANSQAYFGRMANFRIYNTVKDQAAITALAKQIPPPVVEEEKK